MDHTWEGCQFTAHHGSANIGTLQKRLSFHSQAGKRKLMLCIRQRILRAEQAGKRPGGIFVGFIFHSTGESWYVHRISTLSFTEETSLFKNAGKPMKREEAYGYQLNLPVWQVVLGTLLPAWHGDSGLPRGAVPCDRCSHKPPFSCHVTLNITSSK